MGANRALCDSCLLAGVQPGVPVKEPFNWQFVFSIVCSIGIPCVGFILFIAYVFDPAKRKQAVLCLAGAMASFWLWLMWLQLSWQSTPPE